MTTANMPTPIMIAGRTYYLVEKDVKLRKKSQLIQYFVPSEKYDPSQHTLVVTSGLALSEPEQIEMVRSLLKDQNSEEKAVKMVLALTDPNGMLGQSFQTAHGNYLLKQARHG